MKGQVAFFFLYIFFWYDFHNFSWQYPVTFSIYSSCSFRNFLKFFAIYECRHSHFFKILCYVPFKKTSLKKPTNLSRNCRDNDGSRSRRIFSRTFVRGSVCFYGNSTFAFNHGFYNIWFELFLVNFFDYQSFLYSCLFSYSSSLLYDHWTFTL